MGWLVAAIFLLFFMAGLFWGRKLYKKFINLFIESMYKTLDTAIVEAAGTRQRDPGV